MIHGLCRHRDTASLRPVPQLVIMILVALAMITSRMVGLA